MSTAVDLFVGLTNISSSVLVLSHGYPILDCRTLRQGGGQRIAIILIHCVIQR